MDTSKKENCQAEREFFRTEKYRLRSGMPCIPLFAFSGALLDNKKYSI
jgi:hypothetical protein